MLNVWQRAEKPATLWLSGGGTELGELHAMSTENLRREARVDVRVPVVVYRGKSPVSLETSDVSFKGLFVRTTDPPPLRSLVRLKVALFDREFEAHAMAVHVVAGQRGAPRRRASRAGRRSPVLGSIGAGSHGVGRFRTRARPRASRCRKEEQRIDASGALRAADTVGRPYRGQGAARLVEVVSTHAADRRYVRPMIDETILARARASAEEIAPLATQIEQDRRLPAPAVDALVRAGVFKLLVPKVYGGSQAHPVHDDRGHRGHRSRGRLAGWCTMVGATSGLMSVHLDEDVAREVYGPATRSRAACSRRWAAPSRPTAAIACRAAGRSPAAASTRHGAWAAAMVMGDKGPASSCRTAHPTCAASSSAPTRRRVIDTWDTSGLRGTGSHDIEVTDVVVPRARTFSLLTGQPKHAGYTLPFFGVLASGVAAVGLGIARAAIDTFVTMAKTKTPPGSKRTLAHRELVQMDVARAEAKLRSARAFLFEAMEEAMAATAAAPTPAALPRERACASRRRTRRRSRRR